MNSKIKKIPFILHKALAKDTNNNRSTKVKIIKQIVYSILPCLLSGQ